MSFIAVRIVTNNLDDITTIPFMIKKRTRDCQQHEARSC
jgi:hypothetical protein